MGIYAYWTTPFISSLLWLGGDEWKELLLRQRMVRVISLISTITAITVPAYMQEQACVRLDIRACKAKEIFQEFIKYLSHSQMLDWASWDEDQEGVSPEELQ